MQASAIRLLFFFNDTATTEIYTLSLHDALPISRTSSEAPALIARPCGAKMPPFASSRSRRSIPGPRGRDPTSNATPTPSNRSEEHTSELQSRQYLVCRLLLEKKKKSTPLHALHR